MSDIVNIKVEETVEVVSILVEENSNDVNISIQEVVEVVNIKVEEVGIKGNDLTLTDDLIIVTAGKQSNTFVNNVFTFVNASGYTNNTKTLTYTASLLTDSTHSFRYDSKDWTVNYTYSYTLGVYNGVSRTITKI
jgi:hypothetical protein